MKTSMLWVLLGTTLIAGSLRAEEVVWVSLNPVDEPNPADHAFTDILMGAGHNVTRFQLNAQGLLTPDVIDQFNASDLIIIGRANNSGNFNSATEVTAWNEEIMTPVLLMSPYMSRNQRFGWQAADAVPDATAASPLVAQVPQHPVFTGITFEADGMTMANIYNTPVDRGTSTIGDDVVGGTILATNPVVADGNGVAIAEWEEGAVVTNTHVGDQTLGGDRYFFAGGSREAANIPIESSTMDLTADGRRLYFNLVQYAMGLNVPAPGDFNMDGSVDADDFMVLGNNIAGHLDGLVGFPDGDIDLDNDVDLDDFHLFHSMFPGAIGQAAGIPEPSTIALFGVLLAAGGLVRFRARFSLAKVCLLIATLALLFSTTGAQAQVANLWTAETGNYTDVGNWSSGGVPDIFFQEIATINNGGTAFLESTPFAPAGGVLLGEGADDAGTLEIRSGGDLTLENMSGTPAGIVVVGMEGEGHLRVLRGGTLTAVGLNSGGAMESSIVLGEAGGSGTATVNITGAGNNAQQRVNLDRTTRIIGPNVDFNVTFTGNGLNLIETHNLIAEITGPTHSTINVSATARLDGQLTVEFNGHTPAVGESWTLVDATTILGEFSDVNADFAPEPGHGFFVEYGQNDENGMSAVLTLDPRLQLSVDRTTGNAMLENLTSTETFDINGYVVTALDGTLTPDGWASLADGDDAWNEFNPATNHLSELSLTGSRAIGPNSSVSLGSIFAPPGENGTLDNVTFTYHEAGGNTRQGLLSLVDMMPPTDVPGDYNGNSRVEQADLDLVLLNWGQSFDTLPDDWVNERPTEGIIDQAELDGVLLNWGNTAGLSTAAVPEPSTWTLAALACLTILAIRKRR